MAEKYAGVGVSYSHRTVMDIQFERGTSGDL